jgi:hypothetical protein
LGAWAFNKGLVTWETNLEAFFNWKHANIMASFTIVCLSFAHLSFFLLKKDTTESKPQEIKSITKFILIPVSIFCFTIFSILPLDVSLLGGLGDYQIIPKTLATLVLISFLALDKVKFRYAYYLLIIIVFATFSYHDKREAIFLILSILLLEAITQKQFVLKTKKIFLLLATFLFALYLILTMSILRGYGGFNVNGFASAVKLVPQYVAQDRFLPYFFQNIETSISFYHSHQAIEFIENDKSLMTYGATLIKFIFVPIPRSIVDKPKSIVESYTGYYDPTAYQENISWPINFFSELYWNFRYLGFILVVPFFVFFNYCYLVLVKLLKTKKVLLALVPLYLYQYFIFFVRGSGLDLYFFYLLLSSLLFIFFFLIPYLFLLYSIKMVAHTTSKDGN